MITKEHYHEITSKYDEFASWAVWAKEGLKPKSNIGDMSIFDLIQNPKLLDMLKPDVIMVGPEEAGNVTLLHLKTKKPMNKIMKQKEEPKSKKKLTKDQTNQIMSYPAYWRNTLKESALRGDSIEETYKELKDLENMM